MAKLGLSSESWLKAGRFLTDELNVISLSKTRQKLRKPLTAFLLVSLLFHLGLFAALHWTRVEPRQSQTRLEVEFKSADELTPANEESRTDKTKRKQKVLRDQIVEQQKRLNDEVDKTSRFLSAFNQKVIRQTRAARSGKFVNTALGGAKTEGAKDGQKRQKLNGKARKALARGELPKLQDLIPKFSINPGQEGPNSKHVGNPSQTDDYMKDVKTGLQTLLSTREFVYYAYYNRIKEALRQHWEPDVQERVKIIYRQGRSIASAKDRVTQVLVTLDSKGELIKVEVIGQSGVDDLDNAAIQAFREASPFPNPPKGMIESDGTVKIRWDFVLEV
jgi:protein TonB